MTQPNQPTERLKLYSALSRRRFLVGAGGAAFAAAFLAACGSNDDDSTAEAATASTGAAATGTEAATGGSAAASSGTRVVRDARGEIEVPVMPERVVTTEQTLDLAVLGLAPVGARNLANDTRSYPEFADLLKDTVDLGGQDLDLEQVIVLEPDLILTTTGRMAEAERFLEVAPTVFQDIEGPDKKHRWGETLRFYGYVLNREQQVEDLLAAYEARCLDFQTKMGDRLESTSVSVLRVSQNGLRIYTLGSFSGGVLRDAGMRRPENQDLDGFETETLNLGEGSEGFDLSPERLREAEGDVIFVVTSLPASVDQYREQDHLVRANADALKENPLWSQLTAAQNDLTFEVGKHWNGESLVDANKMLDDLERLLLNA